MRNQSTYYRDYVIYEKVQDVPQINIEISREREKTRAALRHVIENFYEEQVFHFREDNDSISKLAIRYREKWLISF